MENRSIFQIYRDANHIIEYAQAYSDKKNLSWIIKACQLKPFGVIYKNITIDKLYLEKLWIDEFGCCLEIGNKKKISIHLHTNLVKRENIISTDTYAHLPIDNFLENGKLVFLGKGTEEIVSVFYSNSFIRVKVKYNGRYENVSPLYLGFDNLNFICENISNGTINLPNKMLFPFEVKGVV